MTTNFFDKVENHYKNTALLEDWFSLILPFLLNNKNEYFHNQLKTAVSKKSLYFNFGLHFGALV